MHLNVLFIIGFCSRQALHSIRVQELDSLFKRSGGELWREKLARFIISAAKDRPVICNSFDTTLSVTSGKALSPSPASLKEFCTLVSRDIFVSRPLPFTANCQFARLSQDSLCSMWSLLQNVWFLCIYASDLFLLVSVESAFIHKCIIVVIIGCEMR